MQVQGNNKVRASWVPTGFLNHTVHLVQEQKAGSGAHAQTGLGQMRRHTPVLEGQLRLTVTPDSSGCPRGGT